MPRLRVIVLGSGADGNQRSNIMLAFWADVPASRQKFYANPRNTSQWIDAQPADIAALVNGSVTEHIFSYNPEQAKTVAQIQADAAQQWATFQARVNARNEWPLYGTNLDATGTWTIVQVS